MITWTNYLVAAIAAEYPGAAPGREYNWVMMPSSGASAMTHWDETVMGGPFVLADWEARCTTIAKTVAAQRINGMHASTLEKASGQYTAAERDTWPVKAPAALAFVAGVATPDQAQWIEVEALEAGEVPMALATMIAAKHNALALVSAKLSGIRRKALAALDAAADVDAFEAIVADAKTAFNSAGNE
ncbi:MAG: hypothetical protein P1U84_12240 [Parvibaculaceae bacterium]|nr:hypothetical protein [Parvibaculaceae bacterium]